MIYLLKFITTFWVTALFVSVAFGMIIVNFKPFSKDEREAEVNYAFKRIPYMLFVFLLFVMVHKL
jgi:hypothetical protein